MSLLYFIDEWISCCRGILCDDDDDGDEGNESDDYDDDDNHDDDDIYYDKVFAYSFKLSTGGAEWDVR